MFSFIHEQNSINIRCPVILFYSKASLCFVIVKIL